MSTPPSVLVVMPAFNCGPYIAAAIDSVLTQSYRNWQLVIVDDGSTDDTGTIADGFAGRDPGRIRVVHQENAGIARARNRALAEATPGSELVTFLDSDDVWLPGTLEKMVAALPDDPAFVGVHGFRTYIDKHGKPIVVDGASYAPVRRRAVGHGRLQSVPESEPTRFECLAYGCCVFTGGLLVRGEVLREVGLFDPNAVPAEDWDMWLRLSLRGPFAFIREPLYGYRLHGSNSTTNVVRKNASIYYVRHKLATDPRLPAPARAIMMTGFRWYEMYRASVCFRQLSYLARTGRVRAAAAIGRSGLRHLLTSVLPGARRLAALGAESGDRIRR